ncbi:ABC transporter ATP-binding protein [Candidatus Clostridium stratigraminis]|uniref:ABC transporter ATP-binding protein n=1 Tax=Candidatus Clostridium stratigraminis TaxID=3381661 RepID=A0ABW8TA47_9CLOT
MKALEVTDVKKRLGKREIIKGISFSVEEGEIFGFIGPNGAGKTTTIRMLVGLIFQNSGEIKIMEHDIHKEREKALSYVGAVVENPDLYKYLTGWQNLMQIARIRNIDKEYVGKIVELVELKGRINDKVKKYSLGMKQRLGLAASLISKPKLLILDEPTNGLDPTGIMDFREIIRKAANVTGTAVFISSHILSEIEQVCDKVAFINDGLIQSVEYLNGDKAVNKEVYILQTSDDEKAKLILNGLEYVESTIYRDGKFTITIDKKNISELIFKLCEEKVPIGEVYRKQKDLEDRYLELFEGGEN